MKGLINGFVISWSIVKLAGDYVLTNGALPATVFIDAVPDRSRALLVMMNLWMTKVSKIIYWPIPSIRARRSIVG